MLRQISVLDLMCVIPDPREDFKIKYPLKTILFGTLCAILCGCQSWLDVADFCEVRQPWLAKYVNVKNGIPSCWTFRRLFTLLDPALIEQLLLGMSSVLLADKRSDQIAIDGKYLCGSSRHNVRCLKSVSAWCHEHGLVLAQSSLDANAHELQAIPLLIECLNLKDTTVTIDAAGCQTSLAQSIRDKGGHYVLALKKNQPKLHQAITEYMQDHCKHDNLISDGFDDKHGRCVRRRYFATDISHLDDTQDWLDLKSVIAVETISSRGSQPVKAQFRYYITSHNVHNPKLAQYVRNHWSIENNLHWTLDVQMKEDDDTKTERRSAKAFATLRRIALNIVKTKDQTKKRSTRRKMLRASWSEDILMGLLV